ncbi:MAG: PAS domain S-box protein [Candidatus Lokiarchaeota archaeon]|nr:PAS domain S-box protein [Candidatus Lokiarchaeota archaeon]MBD3201662.1 PAS domain S-box protein [Candidatus Lokiarchaeota archaeon]
MENELELGENLFDFRKIIEKSSVGFIIIQENLFRYLNDAATKLFKYSKDEMLSWKRFGYLKIIHPLDRALFRKIIHNLSNGELENNNHFEIRGLQANNQIIWLDFKFDSIDYDGKPCLLITLYDITARKTTEKKILKSKRIYSNLVNNANSIILKIDVDGRIVFINQFGKKFFEFESVELIGKKVVGTILPVNEKSSKKFNQMLEDILEYPNKYISTSNENITKSGEKVWISWSNKAITDRNGNLIGIESVGNDITKRVRVRELLRNQTKKLEILNQIIVSGNKAKDISELFENVLDFLTGLLGFEAAAIYLTNTQKKTAELIQFRNIPSTIVSEAKELPIDKDPYEIIFKQGRSLIIKDFDHNFNNSSDFMSMISIPIFDNKEIIGAITVISSQSLSSMKNEKKILKSIGHEIGTIISKFKAEKHSKQNQKNLTRLFNSIEDFIFVINYDGKISKVNQAVLKRLNYTEEEILSINLLDLHPSEMESQVKKKFREILNKKSDVCYFPLKKKNGGLIEVNTKITHGKWGKDDVIFGISRSKEEIKKWEQKLIESEKKFRTIAETSLMGIMIIEDHKVKYYNNALSRILELPENKELRNKSDLVKYFHSDDAQKWNNRMECISEKKNTFNEIFRIETESATIKWLEIFYKAIYIEYKYSEFLTIEDISKRKEAEKLIVEEYNRLMDLNEMRKDIITRISHELKTPLTSMYGASQFLIEEMRDAMTDDVFEFVEMNHRGCVRLTKLIQNLIDATILDSKKINLNLKKEDLIAITNKALNNINKMAESRNLSIDSQFPTEVVCVVDKESLEKAITNILSNAVKNTLPNGTITVKIATTDNYIDISVKDTGIGLTKGEKEKIFRKFGKIERYKMDVDLNIEGSGLGLYIAKEIVELHGGEIIAESEGRNKGATFILRIPNRN